MGTCYYLQRPDGKLFDLDKAYGLAGYLQTGQPWNGDPDPTSPSFNGWPCSLGDDLDALVLVLAERQPYPCCSERIAWAQRMLDFAGGQQLVLFNEHSVPESDEEYGRAGYLDRVIGERWTQSANDHSRACTFVPTPAP